MDLLKSGFYSVLPWITMAISSNLAGYLADTLIQRGTSVTLVRKVMQTVRLPLSSRSRLPLLQIGPRGP